MWYEKYIGLPFFAGGRTAEGLDCWGLTRLIFEERYQIILPSFSGDYDIEDDTRIKELIAQYKEGWDSVETPSEGCAVLFKILGEVTHIGVMVSDTQFIHVRNGSDSVIDRIDSVRWKNRVVGYFKYNSKKSSVVLTAAPHPLKTKKITKIVKEGDNLEQIYKEIIEENQTVEELNKTAIIMVNGMVIPRVLWKTTTIKATDTVEYRAVLGDNGKELFRLVAFIFVAYWVGPQVAQYFGVAQASSPFVYAGIQAATMVVGSLLIDAIAPIRPPTTEDPGTAEPQDLINGDRNPYNPYGSIPVILGKIRITAPLGAKSYVSYPEERESYLNMLLIWGYGPLTLSDFRVGEINWNDYDYNESLPTGPGTDDKKGRITLDRKTTVSQELQNNFDLIYGEDVDQNFKNIELAGPGWYSSGGTSVTDPIGGGTVFWNTLTGVLDVDLSGPSIRPDIVKYVPD